MKIVKIINILLIGLTLSFSALFYNLYIIGRVKIGAVQWHELKRMSLIVNSMSLILVLILIGLIAICFYLNKNDVK